jgi:phosphatidylserine decarboxylase
VYDTAVNTRTLVFIERHPGIGMVCVIPIGITEISSIVLAEGIAEKTAVKKGRKLGWFRFGGSTCASCSSRERSNSPSTTAPPSPRASRSPS